MDSFIGGIGYFNAVIVFCILVFVHEMGHYLVARWCGVRIEVFSIGFGKELFGWTDSHGTRWKFSIVPLGGLCAHVWRTQHGIRPGRNRHGDVSGRARGIL